MGRNRVGSSHCIRTFCALYEACNPLPFSHRNAFKLPRLRNKPLRNIRTAVEMVRGHPLQLHGAAYINICRLCNRISLRLLYPDRTLEGYAETRLAQLGFSGTSSDMVNFSEYIWDLRLTKNSSYSIVCIALLTHMREWLSGGASPCQGEGRGFDPRLALIFMSKGPLVEVLLT